MGRAGYRLLALVAQVALHGFVGARLSYVPGATHIGIGVEEVFELGKGVCQDYAHLAVALCRTTPSNPVSQYFSDYRQGIAYKRGLTFQATVWPSELNSFVGRMSCNGCDPQYGDTACTTMLPVTCIIHPRVLARPYYGYYPDFTPYANPDQSFYEGWTGGIIAVTDPVRGL